MKITIANKEYNYEMNGTVGPAFVVEQMSGEPFNPWGKKELKDGEWVEVEPAKPMHTILLFLVILQLSNPSEKDNITLDFLIGNLTTSLMNELTTYTVKRWTELEGWKSPEEEHKEEEGGQEKNV